MSSRRASRLWYRLLVVGAFLGALALPWGPAEARAMFSGVRVLSSTPEAAVIEFVLPALSLVQIHLDGGSFVEVMAGDLPACGQPGEPQLPCTGALLGLPPSGEAAVRILEQDQVRIPLSAPVQPVPVPVGARGMDRPASVTYEAAGDPAVYGSEALYPASVVELGEPGWVRSQRVARLAIRPVRYDPQDQALVSVQRLVVEVRFEAEAAALTYSGRGDSPAFGAMLDAALLNADVAAGWRADGGGLAPLAPAVRSADGPASTAGSYKVFVNSDGVYRLTYADLQAAGLPVGTLDPRTFQLFEGDRELAIQVSGQADRSFDPGDTLLFYGRVPRSRYTARNVYWLRYGDQLGRRMARRQITAAQPTAGVLWTRARWEQNQEYNPVSVAADGDHWYAAYLWPEETEQVRLELMAPGLGASARLRVYLVGDTYSLDTNPDHHLVVGMNGRPVGEAYWDGGGAVAPSFQVSADRLRSGGNDLTLNQPGDTGAAIEGAWLDAIELDYALQDVSGDEALVWTQLGTRGHDLGGFARQDLSLYDLTDPTRPIELRGFAVTGSGPYGLNWSDTLARNVTYYALSGAQVQRPEAIVADRPSQLRDTAIGADYVLIAHGDLLDAVRPLINQRQLQGLRAVAVDVQDIYDEFGDGRVDPEAIRAFVAYAYQHWAPPAPSYVLLVGDGHYDFLDHYGYGAPNYIPPYLGMFDTWWGETAADNRYAAVVGDDVLPDVMLGRLPVTSPAEAAAVAAKIVAYEREPVPGVWNARHVFVADRIDIGAGDFKRAMEEAFAAFIHDPWVGVRIYRDDMSASEAREKILAAWDRGAFLISYMGHSSYHQWSEDVLLHVSDVPSFRNGQRLPVMLSMTCFTGFFHHPEYGTLDEELVRHQGGGAVGALGSSGLGLQSGHRRLHQGFYRVAMEDATVQFGRAVVAAKLDLHAQTSDYDELLDTYHLFGDPAMVLNKTLRGWPFSSYVPVIINQ